MAFAFGNFINDSTNSYKNLFVDRNLNKLRLLFFDKNFVKCLFQLSVFESKTFIGNDRFSQYAFVVAVSTSMTNYDMLQNIHILHCYLTLS